jgi:signal transduction histidine kinase
MLAFQQIRRSASLEAENQQQARVRELERQVMHNERLASVGRLAAGIAHEINNPLEGMSNYLGLLEVDLGANRTEGTVEMVSRVREGLDRVAGIIRQVLTFSDPGVVPHASVNVNEILDETVRFVKANPSFRKIAVVFRSPESEIRVLGNRITLGQLFLNLLMNACQVQPDGGQIEVAAFQDGEKAVILVADCGPGIPLEVLPRIFEPFYSTRGSTGLGLSVCHGIVTEHRGRIQATNRPEGGAIFSVELPLHHDDGHEEEEATPQSAAADNRGAQVTED